MITHHESHIYSHFAELVGDARVERVLPSYYVSQADGEAVRSVAFQALHVLFHIVHARREWHQVERIRNLRVGEYDGMVEIIVLLVFYDGEVVNLLVCGKVLIITGLAPKGRVSVARRGAHEDETSRSPVVRHFELSFLVSLHDAHSVRHHHSFQRLSCLVAHATRDNRRICLLYWLRFAYGASPKRRRSEKNVY